MYQQHFKEEKDKFEGENQDRTYPLKLFSRSTLNRLCNTVPLGALKSLRGVLYCTNINVSELFLLIFKFHQTRTGLYCGGGNRGLLEDRGFTGRYVAAAGSRHCRLNFDRSTENKFEAVPPAFKAGFKSL